MSSTLALPPTLDKPFGQLNDQYYAPRARKHRHPDRRRDCYELLQVIIHENDRREREEYDAMVRDAPEVVARAHHLPSILVKDTTPPPSPKRPSVRFADPPKAAAAAAAAHKNSTAIHKLRSLLHLASRKQHL